MVTERSLMSWVTRGFRSSFTPLHSSRSGTERSASPPDPLDRRCASVHNSFLHITPFCFLFAVNILSHTVPVLLILSFIYSSGAST